MELNKENKLSLVLILASILTYLYLVTMPGFNRNFSDVSDQDSTLMGQSILFNSGKVQTYTDHTGYATILLVSLWHKAAFKLGLLDGISIDHLEKSENTAKFFQDLTTIARYYSLLIGLIFLIVIFFFSYYFTGSIYYSTLSLALTSVSIGLFLHSIIIRTEFLSALGIFLALLFLYKSRESSKYYFLKPLLLGFFIFIAISSKIQSIIIFILFPLIPLTWDLKHFKENFPGTTQFHFFKNDKINTILNWIIIPFSLIFLCCHTKFMIVHFYWYQLAVIFTILFAIMIFYKKTNIEKKEIFYWLIYLNLGLTLGFLINLYRLNTVNIHVVVSFIDHMKHFSKKPDTLSLISALISIFKYFFLSLSVFHPL